MQRGLWSAGRLEGGEVNESAGRRGDSFPGEASVGSEVGGGGGGSGRRKGTRCRGERHGGVYVITSSATTLPGCRNKNCKQSSWQQRDNGRETIGEVERIRNMLEDTKAIRRNGQTGCGA